MRRAARYFFGAILFLAIAGGVCVVFCPPVRALLAFAYYRVALNYPKDVTETIRIGGMGEPVRVYLDSAGVAHIDAKNETDLMRATGFMHGRNRFFEMDMMRRLARGRVSELVGEQSFMTSTTPEFDRTMRCWGFEQAAEKDAGTLDAEMRGLMEAYVEGVNAALDRYKPIEYRLLGVEPEPWTLEDSFALGRLNAWSVTHNWHQELSRLLLALHAGADRADVIYGSEPWPGAASLPPVSDSHPMLPAIAPELIDLFPPHTFDPAAARKEVARGIESVFAGIDSASNGWAIGGTHTVSGKPIVASDPHLSHFLPSVMMQQHLRCPGLDAIGITIPGLPYVLAGHNERVAWAMTAANADVIDLYVEKTNPEDPKQVMGLNGFEPLTVSKFEIRVRRGKAMETLRFTLRTSRHGPLVNDMFPDLLPEWAPPVALCWWNDGAGDSIAAVRQADRARTVVELRAALSKMTVPVTMWEAADVDGQVALFSNGRLPIRTHHRGTFPAPGWLPEYDWTSVVNPMDIPHGLAGPEGFFAHANNLLVEPSRNPVYFNTDSAPSYRVERILERIAAEKQHTMDTSASIQVDLELKRARRVLPFMLEDLGARDDWNGAESAALALLKGWDCVAQADSAATAIFFATYREAATAALRDEVDANGFEFILAQRYSSNAYDLWFENVQQPVWDDLSTGGVTETRTGAVQAAFKRAVAWMISRQGPSPSAWRWGEMHDIQFTHVFGKQKLLAGFFNLPRAELGGGCDSVWKTHFDLGDPEAPFKVTAGPVFRMVLDLADIEHGRWVLDTGNSGWPGSPHYGDQFPLWRDGQYLPMCSNWGEIEKDVSAVLTLQ